MERPFLTPELAARLPPRFRASARGVLLCLARPTRTRDGDNVSLTPDAVAAVLQRAAFPVSSWANPAWLAAQAVHLPPPRAQPAGNAQQPAPGGAQGGGLPAPGLHIIGPGEDVPPFVQQVMAEVAAQLGAAGAHPQFMVIQQPHDGQQAGGGGGGAGGAGAGAALGGGPGGGLQLLHHGQLAQQGGGGDHLHIMQASDRGGGMEEGAQHVSQQRRWGRIPVLAVAAPYSPLPTRLLRACSSRFLRAACPAWLHSSSSSQARRPRRPSPCRCTCTSIWGGPWGGPSAARQASLAARSWSSILGTCCGEATEVGGACGQGITWGGRRGSAEQAVRWVVPVWLPRHACLTSLWGHQLLPLLLAGSLRLPPSLPADVAQMRRGSRRRRRAL